MSQLKTEPFIPRRAASWWSVAEWMQNKDAGRNLDAIEKYGADNAFFISKITAAGAAALVEPGRRWRNL